MDVTLQGLSNLVPKSWESILTPFPDEWAALEERLGQDHREVTPSRESLFNALSLPPEKVRVLILGQDPYPSAGDAHGLAFSVQREGSLPPTLRNIFIEYQSDLGYQQPKSGDLSPWSDQGVLLLNTVLTCAVGEPQSHSDYGWQFFTEKIVRKAADNGSIAILWGKSAEKFAHLFPVNRRVISAHPSPLSAYRGFFGSKPFSKVNELLESSGEPEFNWALPTL